MDLLVSPAVLIPRVVTEHVVERVLKLRADWRGRHPRGPAEIEEYTPRVVDVGTGSGCIAPALAKELPEVEIHATDISAEALDIPTTNAPRLGLQGPVAFHQTDPLTGLEDPPFDTLVANPPYIG